MILMPLALRATVPVWLRHDFRVLALIIVTAILDIVSGTTRGKSLQAVSLESDSGGCSDATGGI